MTWKKFFRVGSCRFKLLWRNLQVPTMEKWPDFGFSSVLWKEKILCNGSSYCRWTWSWWQQLFLIQLLRFWSLRFFCLSTKGKVVTPLFSSRNSLVDLVELRRCLDSNIYSTQNLLFERARRGKTPSQLQRLQTLIRAQLWRPEM